MMSYWKYIFKSFNCHGKKKCHLCKASAVECQFIVENILVMFLVFLFFFHHFNTVRFMQFFRRISFRFLEKNLQFKSYSKNREKIFSQFSI